MTTAEAHDVDELDAADEREEKPLRRGRRASPRILIGVLALMSVVTIVLLFAIGSVIGKGPTKGSQTSVSDSSAPDLSESEVVGAPDTQRNSGVSTRDRSTSTSTSRGTPHSQTSTSGAGAGNAGGSRADTGSGAGTGTGAGAGGGSTGGVETCAGSMADITGAGCGDAQPGRASRPGTAAGDGGASAGGAALTAEQIGAQLRLRDQLQAESDNRRRAREALAAPIQAASSSRGWNVAAVRDAPPVAAPSSSPASEGTRYASLPSAAHFVEGGNRIVVELTDGIRAGTTVGRNGGIVWGDVVQDVRDQDGAVLLIPKSTPTRRTRVRCAFRAPSAGDRELDLSCDRIVLPDHRTIALRGSDGLGLATGDLDGSSNVSARVDDRRGRLVRVALLTAAVSAIPVAISGTNQNVLSSANPGQTAASNAAASINETAARINQAELTVPPTMYVEAHRRVAIHVDDPIPLDVYQEP